MIANDLLSGHQILQVRRNRHLSEKLAASFDIILKYPTYQLSEGLQSIRKRPFHQGVFADNQLDTQKVIKDHLLSSN